MHDREQIREWLVIGMALEGGLEAIEDLDASDFSGVRADLVAALKRAVDGDPQPLDSWMSFHLGVRREQGEKVTDALLERFRQDAIHRRESRKDGFTASLARLMAEMQRQNSGRTT